MQQKKATTDFHLRLMRLGALTGCHQLPERSFFLRGRQFPVCARCTGAFCGQVIGLGTFYLYAPHIAVLLVFCFAMFFDWLLQYLNILQSDNLRRFITGILCGYALIVIYIFILLFIAVKLFSVSSLLFLYDSLLQNLL